MFLQIVSSLLAALNPFPLRVLFVLILLSIPSAVCAQETGEPPDPVKTFNRAQDLHEKGDLRGAIALYEKALAELPEFPEAEYQRGMAYLAVKDEAAA